MIRRTIYRVLVAVSWAPFVVALLSRRGGLCLNQEFPAVGRWWVVQTNMSDVYVESCYTGSKGKTFRWMHSTTGVYRGMAVPVNIDYYIHSRLVLNWSSLYIRDLPADVVFIDAPNSAPVPVHYWTLAASYGIVLPLTGLIGLTFSAPGLARESRRVLLKRRQAQLALRGRCRSCAYNLTGNTSGICPECGTPIPKAPIDKWPQESRTKMNAMFAFRGIVRFLLVTLVFAVPFWALDCMFSHDPRSLLSARAALAYLIPGAFWAGMSLWFLRLWRRSRVARGKLRGECSS